MGELTDAGPLQSRGKEREGTHGAGESPDLLSVGHRSGCDIFRFIRFQEGDMVVK